MAEPKIVKTNKGESHFFYSDCHSKYLPKSAVKYFGGQKLPFRHMLKPELSLLQFDLVRGGA